MDLSLGVPLLAYCAAAQLKWQWLHGLSLPVYIFDQRAITRLHDIIQRAEAVSVVTLNILSRLIIVKVYGVDFIVHTVVILLCSREQILYRRRRLFLIDELSVEKILLFSLDHVLFRIDLYLGQVSQVFALRVRNYGFV